MLYTFDLLNTLHILIFVKYLSIDFYNVGYYIMRSERTVARHRDNKKKITIPTNLLIDFEVWKKIVGS